MRPSAGSISGSGNSKHMAARTRGYILEPAGGLACWSRESVGRVGETRAER